MSMSDFLSSRRSFLKGTGIAFTLAAGFPSLATTALGVEKAEKPDYEISPVEDLMREHGVLTRCLLIYDEICRRIDNRKVFPSDALVLTARLIQKFVENYHEKLEEDLLFPRFEQAGRFVDLVKVLLVQHKAGRRLTTKIVALSSKELNQEERGRLKDHLRTFGRMYRPHKAREDTVLFPALHEIVSPEEFTSLGESFEDREEDIFGEGGFEKIVDQVAGIEKRLGIFDISQFTPKG